MTRKSSVLLVCCFTLFFPQIPVKADAKLRIAVAANFKPTLESLVADYPGGNRITISTGSTGALAAQIHNGAPFDIFFAADSERPRFLEEKGLTRLRVTYAYGRLAFWKPGARVDETSLAKHAGAIAIANPRHAPYGVAAQEQLDAFEKGHYRIVKGNNVAQAFTFVATGNVSAGLVALSQLRLLEKNSQSYWVVPRHKHKPIRQQLVVMEGADALADDFVNYLGFSSARAIIAEAGYELEPGL